MAVWLPSLALQSCLLKTRDSSVPPGTSLFYFSWRLVSVLATTNPDCFTTKKRGSRCQINASENCIKNSEAAEDSLGRRHGVSGEEVRQRGSQFRQRCHLAKAEAGEDKTHLGDSN